MRPSRDVQGPTPPKHQQIETRRGISHRRADTCHESEETLPQLSPPDGRTTNGHPVELVGRKQTVTRLPAMQAGAVATSPPSANERSGRTRRKLRRRRPP